MNPWSDPNYYGISNALEDVMLQFVQQGKSHPSIEEIVDTATPFFKRAGAPKIGETEKVALDSVRPVMWIRIQEKLAIPDYAI